MAGFKEYVSSFLLLGLFVVCIFTWVTSTGSSYGYGVDIVENEYINLQNISSNINSSFSDSNEWATNFRNDNPQVSSGTLIFTSLWDIMNLAWTSVQVIFELVFGGLTKIFGIPPIAVGVMGSLLIFGLIISAWKLLKTGEGEY